MERILHDADSPGSSPVRGEQNRGAGRKRAPTPTDTREQLAEEQDEQRPATQESDEHYVTLRTDIVGVQYYRGLVGKGEYVMLRRQPDNQYDPDAVQVQNANNVQVGHIPRLVASKLAPLMDENLITVEGRMVGQNLDHAKHYKMAMDMSIYAKGSLRSVLEPELAWATPGQKGFDAMRAAQDGQAVEDPRDKKKFKGKSRTLAGDTGIRGTGGSGSGLQDETMRRLFDGLKKVAEDEKHADGFMDALTADVDVSRLPAHAHPPGTANGQLLVDLLPHQSQALQWMIERENPKLPATPKDPPVQFWVKQDDKKGSSYWLNVATRTPQKAEPILGRGGIIADGMGLGKTLTTLALALATKKDKPADAFSNATLIVCPLSVLSNWEKQIRDHVAPGHLTVYTYHGASKGVTANTLKEYDIVLTTYQTVVADLSGSIPASQGSQGKKLKKSGGPLAKVAWKRVVADEGHVLKNPKAKMAQAFATLNADRRWVCTGTPIVNSPADLGSLLTCLKVCQPLDQSDYFRSLLLRPLRNGDPEAGKLLQAVVGQILLRRTKESKDANGQKIIELPPIEFFQCPIQLDADTRTLYDEIAAASVRRLQEAMRTGESPANVLSLLTRMRQLCLSAELVPKSFLEDLSKPIEGGIGPSIAVTKLSPEQRLELLEKLRQALADDEECAVCFDVMDRLAARITDCAHCFCLTCISMVINRDPSLARCPMCRHSLTMSSLLDLPPDEAEWKEPDDEVKPIKSAKIDELVKYLKAFDPSDKTLVFSQFRTFLDHVAVSLKEQKIQFVRFDGSMSARQRQEVIADFQRPVTETNSARNPRVMLISLKSGAVGLNLTAATNVFLCDPWWQSAIEAQAIDRVHRMGQRKPVRVFQLIAEDTIEARILDIQKRKDELVAKAFAKTSKESARSKKQARFEELKELFGV